MTWCNIGILNKSYIKYSRSYCVWGTFMIKSPTRLLCPILAGILDDALIKIVVENPERANLVKLRYYGGLSIKQAAMLMKIYRTKT